MIEYGIPIIFNLILIIIIYIIYKKYRILKDKNEIARKELEHLQMLEIENKVINRMAAIMKDRILFAQKIMASKNINSLKISEEVKDIIADELVSFLKNLEPDIIESLRILYADKARMKQMLIKATRRNNFIKDYNCL